MSNYTEADYRRIYADLEKKEQESIKAYNSWLMQMQMAINNYNATLADSGLQDTFPELSIHSEQEIENLDINQITQLYNQISQFRDETVESIEIALGLKEGQIEPTQVEETLSPFGEDEDYFDFAEVGNPLED